MENSFIKNILNPISELIIRPRCELCNTLLKTNYHVENEFSKIFLNTKICSKCRETLEKLKIISETKKCKICQSDLRSSNLETCITCQTKIGLNISVHSIFYYKNVIKQLIHLLKYQSNLRVSQDLSALLIEYLKNEICFRLTFRPEIIVPAPSSKNSILNRGFNSTYYLSRKISKKLNIPIQEFTIQDANFYLRSKKEPLKRISAGIPEFNIKNSDKRISLHSSNVLIIDDVISTGATVLGLAKSIYKYNPKKICVISIAQSKYYNKLCLKLLHKENIKLHNLNKTTQ